jgi:hypothetical protein
MAKLAQLKTKTENEVEMIPYAGATSKAGRVRVTIDGITPLLTHNPASMGASAPAMRGGRVPLPEDEAEAGVYRMPDGTCALKGESFRAACLGAAGAWKMKKSSARSRLSHIIVVEDLLALQRRDGTAVGDYTIDARRARVQKQGIIRHRPRFEEWSVTFTIEYDPVLVPDPKLIIDILADAGSRVGVGDYRPACNGWFGRFQVRSYAILD